MDSSSPTQIPTPPFSSVTPEQKVAQAEATASTNIVNANGNVPAKKLSFPLVIVGGIVIIFFVVGVLSQVVKKTVTPSSKVQSSEPTQSVQLQTNEEEEISAPLPKVVTEVELTAPLANGFVSSPLAVIGTVPPGWMFEGQLTLRLLDDQKKLIIEAPGKEVNPGSWQSGYPVDFTGVLTYSTTATSGFLVVAKPNPSGLPENDDSFSIPVKFQ